jgi:hypothetical protein
MVVSILKFNLQQPDLVLEFVNNSYLRIYILYGLIAYISSPCSIIQCRDALFVIPVRWGNASYHQTVAVTSQTLLEQTCQF